MCVLKLDDPANHSSHAETLNSLLSCVDCYVTLEVARPGKSIRTTEHLNLNKTIPRIPSHLRNKVGISVVK